MGVGVFLGTSPRPHVVGVLKVEKCLSEVRTAGSLVWPPKRPFPELLTCMETVSLAPSRNPNITQ